MTRHASLVVAGVLLSLASAPASAAPADEGAWSLSTAVDTRWVWDGSYDLLSANDVLPAFELGVGHRVIGGLTAGLSWQGGGVSERNLLSAYEAELFHQGLSLALTWERPVAREWFRPLVRAEAGVVAARLGVGLPDPDGSRAQGEDVSQWAFAGRYHLGAGVRLVPFSNVRGARTEPQADGGQEADEPAGFSFAIDAELGYTFATDLQFDDLKRPEPEEEPEVPDIPVQPLDLGAFDLSGVELRIGVLMRF